MTSGQTQSFNPFFIIALAPVFAFIWVWLDRRRLQPSTPTKMALGLILVVVAFGVMWPAAHSESRGSTVPLAELPSEFSVDEDGLVYSVEQEEDGDQEQVYYGARRLTYDVEGSALNMSGVLSDLDRLRLLSETAPAEFKQKVEALVEQSAEKAKQASGDEQWSISEVVAAVPETFAIAGDEAQKVLAWDASTNTLKVTGAINDRAKVELLAAAAQPEFKAAVDGLYVDSSMFKVSVWWLVLFYLVLTTGELCLSPVGLSLVTKLAPPRHVGLFMGGWFLATAVAEKLAQVFGAYWGKMPPEDYFLIFVVMCGVGGVAMALLVRPLKRMMHGIN
jgi:POT family proton-dependent oligopeptide transporter